MKEGRYFCRKNTAQSSSDTGGSSLQPNWTYSIGAPNAAPKATTKKTNRFCASFLEMDIVCRGKKEEDGRDEDNRR